MNQRLELGLSSDNQSDYVVRALLRTYPWILSGADRINHELAAILLTDNLHLPLKRIIHQSQLKPCAAFRGRCNFPDFWFTPVCAHRRSIAMKSGDLCIFNINFHASVVRLSTQVRLRALGLMSPIHIT